MPRLCERLARHNNQLKSFSASSGQDSCRRAVRIVDINHNGMLSKSAFAAMDSKFRRRLVCAKGTLR